MNQTTSSILRDRIRKFKGSEFITEDLLYKDPLIADHDAFLRAAIPALGKLCYGVDPEIEIVRKERSEKKGFRNIYKERKLKVCIPRIKPEKQNNPKVLPKSIEVWKCVWPDMFKIPKFSGKKQSTVNHCLG